MTPEASLALAQRVLNTWRGGPPLQEWVDALDPLDEGTAGTAYIRLRNSSETSPTIAAFMRIYTNLATASTRPIRQDSCPLGRCPGDGWVRHERIIDKRTYTAVEPCGCPAGRSNEAVRDAVANHPSITPHTHRW